MLYFIFHDVINFECKKFLFDGLLYKIKHTTEYKEKQRGYYGIGGI